MNPNDPAFPVSKSEPIFGGTVVTGPGLTKREWMAAMALQGLLSRPITEPNLTINGQKMSYDRAAIAIADAFIQELSKREK